MQELQKIILGRKKKAPDNPLANKIRKNSHTKQLDNQRY